MTDVINLDDSMTQAQEEAQFNVYVADAGAPPTPTATPTTQPSSVEFWERNE